MRTNDSGTVVTATRNAGSGILQGTTNVTAVNGVVTYTNLSHNVAANITITFSGSGLASATSDTIAVSPAAASKLTINTQPSTTATAGVAFAQQPVVRIEDQFGNLRTNDSATAVTATRSTGTGTLQGTTNVTAVGGVVTFTDLAHNVATNITIQFTSGSLASATSGTIAVGAAAASQLTINTQPSTSATAGVAFAQQPVIRIEDAFGNLRTNDSTTAVTASRATGTAALQGTTNRTAVNGVVTFTNLSYNVAETITIGFASGSLTAATSGNVVVSAAAASRLTINTQPSTTATAGVAFAQQPVVRIEDQFGNLRTNDNATAVGATRSAGSGTLQGTTNVTAVGGVVTFTNLSHNVATNITIQFTSGSLTNVTSGTIAVGAAAASQLTINTQPSTSATAGVAFAQQPVVRIEDQFGNLTTNDNTTAVSAARSAGTGTLQGNTNVTAVGGVVAFTNLSHNVATNITIAFSSGGLTGATSGTIAVGAAAAAQLSIQTQPPANATAGVAFVPQPVIRIEDAFGNLRTNDISTVVTASRASGSAALQGVTNRTAANGVVTFTNLSYNVAETITIGFASGSLTGATSGNVVVGAATASKLTINTQPSTTATAGVAFAQQPVVRIEDQFGNLRTNDNSTAVGATRSAGTGTLQGNTNVTAVGGVVTFSNLLHNVATNITIAFGSSGLTGATSSTIAVGVAAADHLTIQTQPSSAATAGAAFAQQPVIRIEDAFGNLRTNDSTVVTASRNTGTSSLQGTTNVTASGGVATFANLSYNIAETITISFAGGSLTGTTSGNVVVGVAAASKLTINTQPSTTAVAGVAFAPQPVIRIEDQFGNLRTNDSTVVTATRNAGSGTLQGSTNVAAVGGVVTYTNLSHIVATNITITFSSGSLTNATSGTIAVSPAAVGRLLFATQPGSAVAGAPFGVQPAVKTQDQFGNDSKVNLASNLTVTVSLTAGTGPLLGTTTLDIGTNVGNGLVTYTNLQIDAAGTNKQLTASASGLSNALSSVFTVSAAGVADHLTIQTQPSTNATAGAAFAQQPVIRMEDPFGNLVTNDNSTVVTVSRAMGSAALQGVTNRTATNGIVTFTGLSYNVAETITISFASGSLTGTTSGNVVVSPAAANKLTILTQPSATATAGVVFVQQPVVRIEDQFGNLRTNDTTAVLATRSAGSGTLQGTTSVAAVGGIVTYANLSHNVANTITIQFTSAGLTSATSGNIVVNPAAFTKLQLLVPGETTAPGTPTGKTGTPGTQSAFTSFNVTVNAVDNNWNVATNVTDSVGITATDSTATLPANAALVAGTQNFAVAFNTNGSFIVTATDVTDGSKTNSVSPTITVNTAQFTQATGGSAISADTTGGTFTSLNGPTYTENASGDVGTNTIILNAPAGFIFDTNNPAPSVSSTKAGGAGNNPVVGSVTSVTTNQITYTVTAASSNTTSKLTWSNLRVRPTAGTPLASGNLTRSGGAIVVGLTTNANLGSLREVAGAPSQLTINTQPSTTATAGVAFAQQPIIQVQDQFGNLRSAANGSADNSTVVTASRSAGTGTLQGTTNRTAVNGVVTYTNLSHMVATNITILFSSGSLSNTSTTIAVSAAAADRLAFTAQPGNATAGAPFGNQPVVSSQDQFGNFSTLGLPTNLNLTVSLTNGTGTLAGTTTRDIGTGAGSGTATFTNLQIDAAGTNKRLAASASGLLSGTSSVFTVSAATATSLSFVQQPTDALAGAAINPAVTVRALDNFGNGVPGMSVAMNLTTGTGTLSGTTTNTTDPSGLATFNNLSISQTGTKKLTATAGALNTGESAQFVITPAAANKLTILTQPSTNATAGVVFAQQPVVRIEDQFGNLRSNDTAAVVATRSAGTGTLQGTTNVAAVGGVVTFTNLSHNVATNITILFSSGSLTSATSGTIAVGVAGADHLTIQTQPGTNATAGVAFSPQPVIRIEDQFGNLRTNDSATVVTANRAAGAGVLQGTTNRTAVNGVVTFTNLSHIVATNITILFTGGSLTSATSTNITVHPAVPDHLVIKTQPSPTATAGVPFAQQPVVCALDQYGNFCDTATTITASRNAGSGTLQGTLSIVCVGGESAFTNLSHNVATTITIDFNAGGVPTVTSDPIVISPAAVGRLAFTTQPGSATAGAPFGVQPAVKTQDPFGNDSTSNLANNLTVTLTLTAGTGPLQGTTILDIGTNAGNGVVTFTNLQIDVTGTNKQLTASASGLSNALSSVFTVSPAAADHLTIQTQPPTNATAGVVFAPQPVIRIEDQFGNLRTNDNSTVVTASRALGTAALQGVTNRTAVNGVVTFTNLSYNVAETITINFAGGSFATLTSGNVAVGPGAANRLAIQTQPSSTATAGVPFAQQPVILVQDSVGNLRTNDNSTVVTAARSAGSGTLQGTLTATAVNGVATFTDLYHTVATNITIVFTSGALTNATSSNIVVSPTTATQLAFTTQPGGTSRTGSPLATQPVVKAQDAFGNVSTVGLSANLNVLLTLTSGSGSLLGTTTLNIGTSAGNGSVTYTNVECSDAGTNKQITASASGLTNDVSAAFFVAGVERAIGGTAISADTAGTTNYTTLTGPAYHELNGGDVTTTGSSTIILNAPSGFVFDTGGTAPTVLITKLPGSSNNDSKNINNAADGSTNAITSRTTNQITFTIAAASQSPNFCSLTWQNIRVRPTAATPLVTNLLTKTGTSTLPAVTNSSTSFGTLAEVAGAAVRLTIQTQPSTNATAGVAFAQQPVVRVVDQFGNLRAQDNATVVTATRNAGTGTLQGTTNITVASGVATFTDLSHNVATNITILFTSGSLTNVTSTNIAVSAAPADRLVFTAQPGNGTVGSLLSTQPTVRSQDPFGNFSASGLGASKSVSVNLISGNGLVGTTNRDIGTAAGNGTVSFTNLQVNAAGTNQLQATASGLASIVSSNFTVSKAATTNLAANQSATYSDANQNVTLSATVTGPISVSQGTVTFTVKQGATVIGSPVTSGTVSSGAASATFVLPGGSAAATYTIEAAYSGGADFLVSSDNTKTLTVNKAATTTTATNAIATYSPTNQTVTLTATVVGSVVNEGTVTFTVKQGTNTIGSPVTSATVSGGNASANYTLPGGTGAATYTIQASYSGGSNFLASADNTKTLTVNQATTTTTAANKSAAYSDTNQTVTLTAAVAGPVVNQGTVTFTVKQGATTIGSPVTSVTVSNGSASANYTLPGGTSPATYTIEASYSGGSNFLASADNTKTLTVNGAATTTTASNASATYSDTNQTVTLTATVTGSVVNEGTVTFTVKQGTNVIGSPVTSGTVSASSASASYTLPGGTTPATYSIEASYSGGSNFMASADNTKTLTVNKAPTTTTAANANATYNDTNQTVTLTATVTGSVVSQGTVTFTVKQGTNVIGSPATSTTVSNGSASASYILPGGTAPATYSIEASYSGGSNFLASADNTKTLTVNHAPTTTTASNASATYSDTNQTVTLTATVSGSVVNEGTVTFTVKQGTNVIGSPVTSATVSAGSASANYTLPGGTTAATYSIVASYSGGSNFLASADNTKTLTVNHAPTTTTAANASATYSNTNQTVTLTATVTGSVVNEGTVTFTIKQGTNTVGSPVTSGTVSGGNATANYTLPGGTAASTYTIEASYSGGSNFLASADATKTLTVNHAPTTTTASNASATYSTTNQTVTLTATVIGSVVNEGTVTFTVKQGTNAVGSPVTSGTVSGGSASANYTLPGGTAANTYTIEASYSGGSNFLASADITKTLTVNAAATTTTASNASANYSDTNQTVTLTATVTGSVVNEGTVTFTVKQGTNVIGSPVTSATVVAGSASANYTLPGGTAPATYSIEASYSGGSNFLASADNTKTLTVNQAATTTTAANASATYSDTNQTVSLTATVIGSVVNDGTVTFTIKQGTNTIGSPVTSDSVSNGSASANFELPGGTMAGTYSITAAYSGGSNFLASSDATKTLTVNKATTTNAVSSSANPSEFATEVTFTATLSAVAPAGGVPTGAVQFKTNGIAAGAPVTLTNGTATFSTSSLPLGTNTITAAYPGDANFLGSTNSLNPPQVVSSTTPVAITDTLGALENHSVTVLAEKLLDNDFSPNDDPLTVTGVGAISTNGGAVTLSGGLITYTPAAGFSGADLFTYTNSNGSVSATGFVLVTVADESDPVANRIGDITVDQDGAHVRFGGIPGFTYNVERSTDTTNWTNVGSIVAPANGLMEFTDPAPPNPVFYRTLSP